MWGPLEMQPAQDAAMGHGVVVLDERTGLAQAKLEQCAMKAGFIESFREPPAIILMHIGFHYDYIGDFGLKKLHR
ncbi:hypothetical protein KAM380_058070 [Aeromonas caviae]|nr:hypothetical protein KAM380_058070 [Aeromonas caviae]